MQGDLFGSAEGVPPVVDWSPTRAAGLARLAAFLPNAGRVYARDRNIDRGPTDRANVSALSPWIRRRLVTEEEVIAAVLSRHGFNAAEKFIQEVYWRTYWKGWLEQHPTLLRAFDADRRAMTAQWANDARLERAMRGETGIACFDAWVRELVETGWLHNHARMWFASIWIFTLRLPWALGADFFYKHLLDADPASNTLSWRWVAGLHTRGKHYLATARNIREKTLGRFDPGGQLDERAPPLDEDVAFPLAALSQSQVVRDRRVALLLHEDDLHAESLSIDADVVGIACLNAPPVGNPDGPAARFNAGALDDALARAASAFAAPTAPAPLNPTDLVGWVKAHGVREVVTPYAPVGLVAWRLEAQERALAADGIRLTRLRRAFDARAWPHATAGFFRFKAHIPRLIAAIATT